MGVERAVTRWYALRQMLADEVIRLEARVAQSSGTVREAGDATGYVAVDLQPLQEELAKAQERLRLLGPCPQPMMG